MTLASTAVTSTVVAVPSIAATDDACSWPDLAARFDRYHARWCRQHVLYEQGILEEDDEEVEREWDEIIAEQRTLASLILDRQPVTMADVVLQARATAATNNELWADGFSIRSADSARLAIRRLIDRLCEFAGAPVFPDVSPPSPSSTPAVLKLDKPESGDTELLQLGVALEAAWAIEREKWDAVEKRLKDGALYDQADAAAKNTGEIADRISDVQATTIEGLKVKVRALGWCYAGDDDELAEFPQGDSIDVFLTRSILHDLANLNVGAVA